MKMPHEDHESAESLHAHHHDRDYRKFPLVLPVPIRDGGAPSENVHHFADRLLRRGFPLHLEQSGVVLSPGNWGDDLAYLAELIAHLRSEAPLEPLDIWQRNKLIARIDVAGLQDNHVWQSQVLDYCPRRHETAFGGLQFNKDPWRSFIAMKFGAKTEVRSLEAGVALLVKVLPWVSVRTIMSCQGHGQPARIWFSGSLHSRWCEMIFRHLFWDLPTRRFMHFSHGEARESSANSDVTFDWRARGGEPVSESDLFDQIQIMARRLFDPALCEAIREAKRGAGHFDELEPNLRHAIWRHRRPAHPAESRAAAFTRLSCLPNLPEIGEREKSPGEKILADTLLRRGFPMRLEDQGLTLCPGAMPEDVEFLAKLLQRLEPTGMTSLTCDVWNDRQLLTAVAVDAPSRLDQFRRQVLNGRSVHSSGWISAPVWEPDRLNSFDGFRRTRYGARFPLVYLEEGVALLVKILPWLGVFTSMSCEGHLDRGHSPDGDQTIPRIWFINRFHREWCRILFERLCGDLEIARQWVFEGDELDSDWRQDVWLATSTAPTCPEEQKHLFAQIQEMARRFFDPELCSVIRAAKGQATSLDGLGNALDRGLAQYQHRIRR